MTDPFSMKELKDALKKVKTKKAPGPDGITEEMLKHLGACSRAVLHKIFNHSWMKGVVPAVWKEAIVIPVPKKGKDKKNPRSYRPISLLSCVGKLLERMVNRRLINHLESNNVLSPTQTGYRKFRSTEDQLVYLAQNIKDAFQEKRKILAVFFDLSNAFDKVWKEGLLVKLLRIGVRYKMYMWIQHFLFARTARVKLNGILSKKVCLREGVPQGSVLSPTLFLVYINDILTTLSKRVSNTLHADDLAIWNASEHTTTATYRIQEAISGISKWTLEWGLQINTSKTNSTLFSLFTSKEQIKLRLKDEIVPQTDTPTFLGVKLDTQLTWKPQKEKMERSSLQKLALMRKLAGTSWGADSSILTKVYTATVQPTMEYASTTWGTAAKTNKSRLDKVQNMALRVILGAMKTTPVHDMEKTASVEPLERRRSLKILIQGEKLRRLPSHPLHTNLAQPTKNHLKRQSLNHKYKELSRTHQDIVDVPIELLTDLPGSPTERQTYKCFWVSQASPQRNSSLESSETSPLPWLLTDSFVVSGYQAHLDPIWRLERAHQTTIFRLRTGHCGLSAHLKRIGISDTSLCECGQADQTPDHVLQSCPKYAERCQLTWPQGADLATKLWGSAEDLYRTASFVASTGLKVWPAWLSIAEEEEQTNLTKDQVDKCSGAGICLSSTKSYGNCAKWVKFKTLWWPSVWRLSSYLILSIP